MADRPIPRDWNSRVLWLLEHLLGMPNGSVASGLDLPLGAPTSDVLLRRRVPITGAGAATEVEVQLPTTTRSWLVVGFAIVRSGGSASSMQPRVGEAASFAAGGLDERMTYDVQGVTIPIRDVFCAPIPVRADAAGKVYLRPGFNAGTDNDAVAELWLRQAFESEGTD